MHTKWSLDLASTFCTVSTREGGDDCSCHRADANSGAGLYADLLRKAGGDSSLAERWMSEIGSSRYTHGVFRCSYVFQ